MGEDIEDVLLVVLVMVDDEFSWRGVQMVMGCDNSREKVRSACWIACRRADFGARNSGCMRWQKQGKRTTKDEEEKAGKG